jgi:hypothetical protein
MATPETPTPHRPDPQYRAQDHIIFAALVATSIVAGIAILAMLQGLVDASGLNQ